MGNKTKLALLFGQMFFVFCLASMAWVQFPILFHDLPWAMALQALAGIGMLISAWYTRRRMNRGLAALSTLLMTQMMLMHFYVSPQLWWSWLYDMAVDNPAWEMRMVSNLSAILPLIAIVYIVWIVAQMGWHGMKGIMQHRQHQREARNLPPAFVTGQGYRLTTEYADKKRNKENWWWDNGDSEKSDSAR